MILPFDLHAKIQVCMCVCSAGRVRYTHTQCQNYYTVCSRGIVTLPYFDEMFTIFTYPVDFSGTIVVESPDSLLLSGTVVGENLDHIYSDCWLIKH